MSYAKIKVLLMEKISDAAAETFAKQGYEVLRHAKLPKEEFLQVLKTVNILGIRSKTEMPKEYLDHAESLMAIGCFCIGTDTTNLSHAAQRGIPVFNSPYANTRSVAELVIAEMIMLARQAGDRSKEMHTGEWNKKSAGCYEVRGKTLGIIGYGHVGMQLSTLAESMGMTVVFCDVVDKLALGNSKQATLDELLAQSDFVSLHVPKIKSTENLITKTEVAKMKKGSYLLNLSRGNVVDNDDVAAALKSGHLAGAAFDVYPKEPPGHTTDFKNPLIGCPNTILTPHIGGSTEEAQRGIGLEVAGKLVDFVNNGSTMGAVNMPNVQPPGRLQNGYTRVMNCHKNVPGALRAVNNALSEGNITFQALSTGGDVGYLIVDLESSDSRTIKHNLDVLEPSIVTYVLQQGEGYCGTGRGPSRAPSPVNA